MGTATTPPPTPKRPPSRPISTPATSRAIRRPADKPTAIQPRFLTQWSMLHAVGGASKLPAKVNDRSGASGGA
jgi:hypothetical protein